MKRGDVIQANENAMGWCGTILTVSEVKEWGVQAFVHIPFQGDAYIRLRHDQYDSLGASAVLMPEPPKEEQR